ncbi:hypothetical protein [Streptomyces sp. NPDC001500]
MLRVESDDSVLAAWSFAPLTARDRSRRTLLDGRVTADDLESSFFQDCRGGESRWFASAALDRDEGVGGVQLVDELKQAVFGRVLAALPLSVSARQNVSRIVAASILRSRAPRTPGPDAPLRTVTAHAHRTAAPPGQCGRRARAFGSASPS